MNHLNNCFHGWPCASGSHKDYLLPCSNGIPLQDSNILYLPIWNIVAHRDPANGRLGIVQEQFYMPHKCSWGKFKVPFLYNCYLNDQLRRASFDLQWPKLWIILSGNTSRAYNQWEWKKDHWLIKSTQHSLPSQWPPSTIVCRPGKQTSLGSR